MTKQGGLGANLYIDGYDLSGDIQQINRIGGGPQLLDVTGINVLGMERIGGKRDGAIDMVTFFNPDSVSGGDATDQEHEILSALPTADAHLMVAIPATPASGLAVGDVAACEVAKQANYDPNRADDGSLTFSVQAMSNATGVEWGRLLTDGKRTDTTGTNGDTYDQTTVETLFGWQAYAQVFSVTGTSVTLTLEDSANGADWTGLTGGAFTAVADPGPGVQRLVGGSTATVRRYVRVTSSGTFTEAIFAVMFVRNLTAVSW